LRSTESSAVVFDASRHRVVGDRSRAFESQRGRFGFLICEERSVLSSPSVAGARVVDREVPVRSE